EGASVPAALHGYPELCAGAFPHAYLHRILDRLSPGVDEECCVEPVGGDPCEVLDKAQVLGGREVLARELDRETLAVVADDLEQAGMVITHGIGCYLARHVEEDVAVEVLAIWPLPSAGKDERVRDGPAAVLGFEPP